jgi:hypothetical protein
MLYLDNAYPWHWWLAVTNAEICGVANFIHAIEDFSR